MGYNWRFELYKVKREIKKAGKTYIVERPEIDEYKEKTGKWLTIGSFQGLFHENAGGFAYLIVDTGARIIDKKDTWILCDYQDVLRLKPQLGDRIKINEKYFEFHETNNIQAMNIIGDLNLKVINDEGKKDG